MESNRRIMKRKPLIIDSDPKIRVSYSDGVFSIYQTSDTGFINSVYLNKREFIEIINYVLFPDNYLYDECTSTEVDNLLIDLAASGSHEL